MLIALTATSAAEEARIVERIFIVIAGEWRTFDMVNKTQASLRFLLQDPFETRVEACKYCDISPVQRAFLAKLENRSPSDHDQPL